MRTTTIPYPSEEEKRNALEHGIIFVKTGYNSKTGTTHIGRPSSGGSPGTSPSSPSFSVVYSSKGNGIGASCI